MHHALVRRRIVAHQFPCIPLNNAVGPKWPTADNFIWLSLIKIAAVVGVTIEGDGAGWQTRRHLRVRKGRLW